MKRQNQAICFLLLLYALLFYLKKRKGIVKVADCQKQY